MNSKKIHILQLNNLRKDFFSRVSEKVKESRAKPIASFMGKGQVFLLAGTRNNGKNASLIESANDIIRLHQLIGSDNTRLYADDIFNIALLYDIIGNHSNSILLYRESIKILESTIDISPVKSLKASRQALRSSTLDDCIEIFYRMGNMAIAYAKTSDYKTAIALLLQIREKLELLDKKDSYDYARNQYNLGNIYYETGKFADAVKALVIAEGIIVKASKLKSINSCEQQTRIIDDIVDVHCSLGYAYEALEEYGNAVAYLEKALVNMSNSGYDTLEISKNTFYLANLCVKARSYEKALEYYDQTMMFTKRLNENSQMYYPRCLNGMAEAAEGLGMFEKSLEYRLEACDQIKQSLGENHVFYANCLQSIGVLYKGMKDYTSAVAMLKHSLEIKKAFLGGHSLEVIGDLIIMVDIYAEAGDTDSALELIISALSSIESDRNDLEEVITRLAKMFMSLGDINDLNEIYNSIVNK